MKMKKIILPLAFAAIMGMSMSAQTNNSDNNSNVACTQQKEQCNKSCKDCEKRGTSDCVKKKEMMHKGQRMHVNPFQGIELTADQQAKLKALREDRQRNDEANAENRKAQKEEQMKQYNEKVKSILTPEQYAQYEKNLSQRPDRMKQKGDVRKGDGKRHQHGGDRPQKSGKK